MSHYDWLLYPISFHFVTPRQQVTNQPEVEFATPDEANVYTDECSTYDHLSETHQGHAYACHTQDEWARDDDARELHCNTLKGIWTGLRNFLRPFRGIHKKYLALYVAMLGGLTISNEQLQTS